MLPIADIERRVRLRMSPARFRHVRGVVEAAADLASRWGVDAQKARLAAVLHDVARDEPSNSLLKQVLDFGIMVDEITRGEPALLHAVAGASVAEHEFGVRDPDVLAAIRYHTTGRAGMSRLERVIYLADCIEPGRDFPGVARLQELARSSLDGAVLAALEQTIRYVLDRGRLLHPDTVAARNDLLGWRS